MIVHIGVYKELVLIKTFSVIAESVSFPLSNYIVPQAHMLSLMFIFLCLQ